ncbi:MAG: glycosyltransferase [Promethearchaeota archaeon]|nr:MAG: glycosyltransferase [Candidatus Lokiarchaeota archaeon]
MTSTKQKIWIFTFEYAGVIKVGGLGEVPANQAKYLADFYEITVFMPSHGQVEKLKNKGEVIKLPITCQGKINSAKLGIEESNETYNISFYKYTKENVDIILLSGNDPLTRKFLDDPTVYNPDTIKGKIGFFSLGMKFLINSFLSKQPEILPNAIHLHDYHVVISFYSIKQLLEKNSIYIPSVITIHLLTWPRLGKSFYKDWGIDDTAIRVKLIDGIKYLTLDEIFSLTEENEPSVEKIGSLICDIVTTVSQSYLNSDIIPNLGKKLIEFKSDFIWDGCDWNYDEIYKTVIKNHGEEIQEVLSLSNDIDITKEQLKKYLLEYKLGNLSESPLISSAKVLKEINEISNGNPFIRNGRIKAFQKSGPLILTTGRISPQKGFETIFKAIPEVIKVIPEARFLFLILPTDYSLNEIKEYSNFVKNFPENIRIIFGVASDIFYLAHIASDVYCALSRWEPFGIMALEAMASRVPVIATRVGGLKETILDIRTNPEKGTGLLINKDNETEFAEALISLLLTAKVAFSFKNNVKHNDLDSLISLIPEKSIKSLVLSDFSLYYKMQDNCQKRVKENFTWEIVSKKLIKIYTMIQKLNN